MEQPLRITVQLHELTLNEQMAALGWEVTPRRAVLARIRAHARAVRPL